MWRGSFLVLLALVLLGSSVLFGCRPSEGNAGKSNYSSDDVISSFCAIAKDRALPDSFRQEYLKSWSTQTILGKVKRVEDDVFEIQFPDISLETMEVWGIDMNSSKIQPMNGGALLSALLLFCRDRDDQKADCQSWVRLLDALVQD